MTEIRLRRLFRIPVVEAINMLPGIASLAVDGRTVVVRVVTNTLDRVRLFVHILGGDESISRQTRTGNVVESGLGRRRNRRWYRNGPFCHNLGAASRWLQMKRRRGRFTGALA